MRKYPTKSELISYIDDAFEEFQASGLNAKQALSRVKYEYEYLENKGFEFKIIILTHLYTLALKNGFSYTSVQNELNSLIADPTLAKQIEELNGPIKKLDLGEERRPFQALATIV